MFLFVIPTFNERENVQQLLPQLLQLFEASRVVIVDDNSPDGTGAWCDEFAADETRLTVLHRPQRLGIGAATIEGLQWGMRQSFEWLVTLDGDLSHDPLDLHAVANQITVRKADVWIGSRYCKNSSISSWSWHRRLSSRGVNWLAKVFLRLPITDYSGAYRVYHRTALEALDLNSIQSTGYAYLEEMLVKLHRLNIRFKEFPIHFNNRRMGSSKAGPMQSYRAAIDLVRIFLTKR